MMMRAFLAAALVAAPFMIAAVPAQAQPAEACPANGTELSGSLDCSCSVEALQDGPVWGDVVYTSDSSLCVAALHAGVIGPSGGTLTVEPRPGEASYASRQSTWVLSSEWGQYDGSFVFTSQPEQCPAAGRDLPGSGSCYCPADAIGGGSVWGTNAYTDDSALCQAALHAGVIGPEGGTISVVLGGGLERYPGSEQNGVTTSDWPAWSGTVFFERYKQK
jgi:hypothetical protein